MDSKTSRLSALFDGLTRAYGQYTIKGRASTVRKACGPVQWEAHLTGKIGLGMIPIRDDSTCLFGAIDIDVDTIDHQHLAEQVKLMNLPLIVCRSKSGGAHCYRFYKDPVPAKDVIQELSRYAASLGHGGCEIFPKQEKLMPDSVGNWINLPYFNGESTNRMGFTPNGPMGSIDEFLYEAEQIKNQAETSTEDAETLRGAPPCLLQLMKQGVPEGQRNEAMYNYAVYFKRRSSENWEDDLAALNYKLFKKPLSIRELNSTIKSVAKKDYGYKCSQAPISSVCDRPGCLKQEFGIKQQDNSYEELMLGSITKVLTDPPRWVLEINGIDITLSTEDVMDYRRVRVLCMERIDIVAPPMKQEDWLQLLKDRMSSKTVVEAPDDTGQDGQLKQALYEFVSLADRSRDKLDVMRGIPAKDKVDDKDVVIFRSNDLISYIKRKKFDAPQGAQLWLALRSMGCGHTKMRVGKKVIQVWYAPAMDSEPLALPMHREEPEI